VTFLADHWPLWVAFALIFVSDGVRRARQRRARQELLQRLARDVRMVVERGRHQVPR
jgi:hypothetical protein